MREREMTDEDLLNDMRFRLHFLIEQHQNSDSRE